MIEHYVPKSLRAAARESWRERTLRRAVGRLMAGPATEPPAAGLLAELCAAWRNEGSTADLDFLTETARCAARVRGPVLECGSGLTTLLLGALAGRRWVEIWSLEHDHARHTRVAALLRRHRIPGVHLCLAPLRSYGEYQWYTPPRDAMPGRFSLVICEGPPGHTPGGRYGLLPVMHDRLAPGTVILLDDAARESEAQMLLKWTGAASLDVNVRQLPAGPMAEIEVRA